MQMTQEDILKQVTADVAQLKTLAKTAAEKEQLTYGLGTLKQLFNLVKKPSDNEKHVTSEKEVARIMAMFEKITIDKSLTEIINVYTNFDDEMKAVEIGQDLKKLFSELKQLTTQEFLSLNTQETSQNVDESPRSRFSP